MFNILVLSPYQELNEPNNIYVFERKPLLDKDQWLKDAKKIPIGSSRRIWHGAEKRPNLVIWNNEDSWSAYCHSCHDGGKVMKEYVKPVQKVIQHVGKDDPGKCYPLLEGFMSPDVPLKDIIGFVQSKGLHLQMLKDFNPRWSTNDLRIVVETAEGLIGRTMNPKVLQKWYSYKSEGGYFSASTDYDAPFVVLTEDFFSAAKAQWYAPRNVQVIALLGTSLHKALLTKLMNRSIIICTDNDTAGRDAAFKLKRRFDLLGLPNETRLPENGLDPKDMNALWFRDNLYKGLN